MIRIKRIFCVLFLVFINVNYATDSKIYKYNLSVCAVFKNEAKHIKEWIEYHKLIGVDHFYLYSSGSSDYFLSILNPYIDSGEIQLMQWPDASSQVDEDSFSFSIVSRISAYENACRVQAIDETKWLIFLNIDEFLLPPNGENIHALLEKYDEYPGVTLSSNYFNAEAGSIPPKNLMIESTKLTKAMSKNNYQKTEKTIFKPKLCQSFTLLPFKYQFKNRKKAVHVRKRDIRINKYLNRGEVPFQVRKNVLQIDSSILSKEELNEILNQGYEIEDQEKAIYQYIPEILNRMGLKPILN